MKYSFVKNNKVEAFIGGKGLCICCNEETIAKCGTKKIHHWAHKSLKHCDNWWENETEWHRKWKSHFPKDWQEVVHFDNQTNEKHIADVKTDKGIIIEFQNSPMSIKELVSREQFYKKMVWVINGEKFINSFHILDKLPNPNAEFAKDIIFHTIKVSYKGKLFSRYSENPHYYQNKNIALLAHDNKDIEKEIEEYYIGHHFFDWIKPRSVWYEAKCNVFFDFNTDVLWKLMKYDNNGLLCVRKIEKSYFIERALGIVNVKTMN